jgi:hypothetical protein
MNTYLIPVVKGVEDPFIIKVIAKGYKEAQEKIMKKFYEDYDFELITDLAEFIEYANNNEWGIGEISDKDDF